MDASFLINRRKDRTVFADYVMRKQQVKLGIISPISSANGRKIGNDYLISSSDGAVYTTVAEEIALIASVTPESAPAVVPFGWIHVGSILTGYVGITPSILTIPSILDGDTITQLGPDLFKNNTSIINITIPDTITSIDESVFQGCTVLTTVDISFYSTLTTIGINAFNGCTALTTLTIPDTVTSIGTNAFNGCTDLISLTFNIVIPPTFGTTVFTGVPAATIFYVAISTSDSTGITAWNAAVNAAGWVGISVTGTGTWTWTRSGSNISGISAGTLPATVIFPSTVDGVTMTGFTANCWLNNINIVNAVIPASITSIGTSVFQGCTALTAIKIPTSVTSIGTSSFQGCTGLIAITIPTSVTTIGASAFQSTALTSITIPNSVTTIGASAFQDSTGLIAITIPTLVTSIGTSSFQGCTALISVTIPTSVTIIGASSFQGCTGLTAITIPTSVTIIGASAFQGCTSLIAITIPNSVTSIGASAFQDSTGLTTVIISQTDSTLTSIGANAFNNCIGLTSITIPNSVTTIGDTVLAYCASLTTFNISQINSTLSSIGTSSFQGCTSLTTITIPNSVTSISNNAFRSCTSLTTLTFSTINPPTFGTTVFTGVPAGAIFYVPISTSDSTGIAAWTSAVRTAGWTGVSVTGTSTWTWRVSGNNISGVTGTLPATVIFPSTVGAVTITGFTNACWFNNTTIINAVIPNTVTSIGASTFQNCTALTSITIPNSVTLINGIAFRGCTRLITVNISQIKSSLSVMISSAFRDCTALTTFTIPNSLTAIYQDTFRNCTSLTTVNSSLSSIISTIDTTAFQGCTALTSITIPTSVVNIAGSAFNGCTSLTTVTFSTINPPTFGTTVFTGVPAGATFYVPISTDDSTGIAAWNSAVNAAGWIGVSVTGTSTWTWRVSGNNIDGISSGTLPATVVFPSTVGGVTMTGFTNGCWLNNTNIVSVVIPNSVTSIGTSVFQGCTALTTVNISFYSTLTSIGISAFNGCTSLTTITFPNSVTSIGASAFSGCTGLIVLTFNITNLPTFGAGVFTGVPALAIFYVAISISDSTGITAWTSAVNTAGWTGVSVTGTGTWTWSVSGNNISGVTGTLPATVIFPSIVSGVTITGFTDYCWQSNSDMINAVIPNTVTSIGPNVFFACVRLRTIRIPNSVTSIGDGAFILCLVLTAITIPNSVTSIRDIVFSGCQILRTITFSTVTPPTFGGSVFDGVPASGIFYVPLATTDPQITIWNTAVNAAGWTGTTVTRSPP